MDEETPNDNTTQDSEFKKPILVGKIGRFPKKIQPCTVSKQPDLPVSYDISNETDAKTLDCDSDKPLHGCEENKIVPDQFEKATLPPYQEPEWSSLPHSNNKPYVLEVLKSGSIVETINLMSKSCWMFGRSTTCDIPLAHPAISRFHAVLQYRGVGTEGEPGFYIYDLASTHGSFVNKGRIKPHNYTRIRVGYVMKFGFSTRSFVLTGPEEDAEEESEFTLTELKQQRAEKLLKLELAEKEAKIKEQQEIEQERKREEERGVDWGLGEDAEDEPDLTENPYAQTNNEELYLEDPKKALRGFMEREGFNLDYDCSEHGFGQFLCKVELPIDDEHGRPIIAEVLHKGKKKEAVVQCALEACQILDRHGVLRQATHESRKRKTKNWEENDYYDSDDDTFLDRTGTIEKKREKRMNTKQPPRAETYQSLLEKEKKINAEILKIEKELANSKQKNNATTKTGNDDDALDSYMKELDDPKLSKHSISKLRSTHLRLRQDLATVAKLLNFAKPTTLPQLVSDKPAENILPHKKQLPLFGKRLKTKLQLPIKPAAAIANDLENEEEEECDGNTKTESKVTQENTVQERIKTNSQVKDLETQTVINTSQKSPLKSNFKMTFRRPSNSDDNDDSEDDTRDDKELTLEELKKRQRKNQRRIKQRRGKAEIQKQKGYEEDAQKADYNMWIPPTNQTGDGRTTLNEKFGY